jgi:methylmalonyl-CoA epimerase
VRLESGRKGSEGGTTIAMDSAEARALRAALGEICGGFAIPDFNARIGGSLEDARSLFARFDPLGDKPTSIELTEQELRLLHNAQAATLDELGVEEYATRTGVEFSRGRAILASLVGLETEMRKMRGRYSIDHLGIAVKSLSAAKAIYENLGLSVSPEETVEHEQVRLVMVPVGESRLELLEPTSENSTIAKFIAKRGEGLHHVCLKVPDLVAAVERLKKDGVRLVSEEIKVGAGGHRYVFVHPSSTGGVLLELAQG